MAAFNYTESFLLCEFPCIRFEIAKSCVGTFICDALNKAFVGVYFPGFYVKSQFIWGQGEL